VRPRASAASRSRFRSLHRLALWSALLSCAACSRERGLPPTPASVPARPSSGAPRALQILATADVGSDTEVCGCKVKPLGGLVRRARAVRERARRAQGATLVLDAGDVFFRDWVVPPGRRAHAEATAALHADALALLETRAVAVGDRDLALGLPVLRRLGARARTQLLAVNLRHAATGTAAFAGSMLTEVGGVKVGVLAAAPVLAADEPAQQVYALAGLEATDPAPLLAAEAQALRGRGAELVIALLHLGEQRARAVLEALPEGRIDLAVVGGDRRSSTLLPVAGGKSLMVLGSERGKHLVALSVELRAGATGMLDAAAAGEASAQLAALDARIAELEQELASGIPDPDRQALLERLRRRRAQQAGALAAAPGVERHAAHLELVELSPELPDDPELARRYAEYQAELAGEAVAPGASAELAYLGSEACKACHAPAYRQWKTTPHARAFATLARARQTANLDCVPCHVTGFERPGGPARRAELGPRVDVGCESCHGPGSAHAAQPSAAPYPRQVPERVCAECHRAQGDQKPFVYGERLRAVLGEGHGAQATP
jgi:hypothetical protein